MTLLQTDGAEAGRGADSSDEGEPTGVRRCVRQVRVCRLVPTAPGVVQPRLPARVRWHGAATVPAGRAARNGGRQRSGRVRLEAS